MTLASQSIVRFRFQHLQRLGTHDSLLEPALPERNQVREAVSGLRIVVEQIGSLASQNCVLVKRRGSGVEIMKMGISEFG